VQRIEGLQDNVKLKSLYLQENLISKIEGLITLSDLYSLNLSDNIIHKIEGLSGLKSLQNLQLKRNRIGRGGIEDLVGLLECPSVSVLDISENSIDDPEILP
jgi:dynein assembly factor 1